MFIGLDVGTSGTKAALVDEKGNILRSHQVNYGFSNTAGGYRELDAARIWEAAKTCLLAVGKDALVRTITVSVLGEAIVPINHQGNPIAPGIIGTDIRGIRELDELREKFGERNLIDCTGQNLSTIYSANKILWLKKNRPHICEKTWKILTFQDYMVYRLCGYAVIDYSMAARTMMFDINRMDWDETLVEAAGIDRAKLADPMQGGSVAGMIRKDLAEELGLIDDIKIVVGTHDHIANAVGCGACEVGSCANPVGTTEGLTAVLKREQLNSESIQKFQISCQPFAVKGLFNTVAWHNTSGVLLKWFVQEMMIKDHPRDILEVFEQMNQQMNPEPTKLFVLPHFSGAATPYMDSESTGAVLGLTLDTKREDIYKALMEGANFETAMIMDLLKAAGLQPSKFVVTGGAASPQLLQMKADTLGLTVHTVKCRQTGTLGGAIMGAVSVGAYATLAEAAKVMVQEDIIYEPDPRRNEIYREKLELYKKIYPAIADISHAIVK